MARQDSSRRKAEGRGPDARWEAARPTTMVDHAVSAIISGASRGVILPGDRIVEADLVKALGISRVPIREALRILESQGVVTSSPYKGIRLMDVTHEVLEQILDVRSTLEILAVRRALEAGRNGPEQLDILRQDRREIELMAVREDTYGFALADAAFHRDLVRFSGNPVLSVLWESLSRQVTIIGGLATLRKSMPDILAEHDLLIDVFAAGDMRVMERELHEHIVVMARDLDFDAIIRERRAERAAAADA